MEANRALSPRASGRQERQRSSAIVPFVPWGQLQAHLARNWKQGEHVTLIGKTGSGKTHLALELTDMRRDSIIVATKRNDELLDDAVRRGYHVVESMREVPRTESGHPVYHKVALWPARNLDGDVRLKAQRLAIKEALEIAEKQRWWSVLIDETMWAYDKLQLKNDLDSVWYQGRSSKISLIACAQRPTRVPRLMIAQASHLFLWYVSDKRDLEPLRDIAGVTPREVIETNLPSLSWDRHEFLYVGADSGYIARSIAPPR